MRRLLVTLALVVGLQVGSAEAAPFTGTPSPSLSPTFGTLIDFDDLPTGTLVGAGDYAGLGVTITELEGLGTFARYAGSQSLPNYIGTGLAGDRGDDGSGWDGTIRFDFTVPTGMVGIGVADSAFGPEVLSIYNSSDVLLEFLVSPVGANTYSGFTRPFNDIAYLTVVGNFFALDDLQFAPAAVPEPGTVVLLGAGLVGLAALRRRRS